MSLTTDVLVVGAGMAGFAAAVAARDAGARVTVLGAGAGATVLSGAAWDAAADLDSDPRTVATPSRTLAERIGALCRAVPQHPYARVDADPVELVQRAHERLLPLLACAPSPPGGHGLLLATDLGLLRRADTAQPEALDLAELRGANVAVAVLRGYRGCDGRFLAASLAEIADAALDERRFAAVEIEFFRRRFDADLHPHQAAAIVDARDGRARLVSTLRRALAGGRWDAVLLPPILGLDDDGARPAVEAALGLPVGEVVSALAGPQGLRWERRMASALEALGCAPTPLDAARVEHTAGATRVTLGDGTAIEAGATVLATGKHVGGGIVMRDGALAEPLCGLPIFDAGEPMTPASDGDPLRLFGAALREGGPGFRGGVGYDPALRALGGAGGEAVPGLFVAGALLDGVDPARDGAGLGCSAATGFLAGAHAAAHALGTR